MLRAQEAEAATAEVCRHHGISARSFRRWKAKFGGMTPSGAARLKPLEDDHLQPEADRAGDAEDRRDPPAEAPLLGRGLALALPPATEERVGHAGRPEGFATLDEPDPSLKV